MAAEAQLLLLVLLLAWPWPFVGSLASLHPVVLLPAYSCSQLDARLTHEFEPSTAPSCGARMGKGWFRQWENYTALQEDPALVPCYAELLRLVYDPVAGDYRNVQGVETRVVPFRAKRGFGSDDPATKNICMGKLIQALEGVGYREGENLFGAPYDFRYAPAPPGQASRGFSRFLSKGHGRWRHLFNFPTLIFFLQNKYDPDPTLMFFLHPFNFLKVLSWFTDAIE